MILWSGINGKSKEGGVKILKNEKIAKKPLLITKMVFTFAVWDLLTAVSKSRAEKFNILIRRC